MQLSFHKRVNSCMYRKIYQEIQKVDILAIGVHPDDIELSASGTLLSHIKQGKTVGLLDMTRGELGTRGSADLRDKESARSAEKMGAKFRVNLEMADGFFEHNKENLLKLIRVIRAAKPQIILCNALNDRHPDHGRSAKLQADACFYSGLMKIETFDEAGNLQERHRPRAFYHYVQDRDLTPDFSVDITDFMSEKIELVKCFASQFHDPESKEPATPLTGLDFFEILRSKNKTWGRPMNFGYAEGFLIGRLPGVKDLFSLY